jgi:crotonobetainyl-CoA:carnitine CoA-transferase CaiB-like acyl-CoA transferase
MADIQAPTANRDTIQQLLNSNTLRQHAHDFAAALRAWPVICQHAKTLS